jgi:hypothetical protein
MAELIVAHSGNDTGTAAKPRDTDCDVSLGASGMLFKELHAP